MQLPVVRSDPEPVSENEEDSYEDEVPEQRSAQSGPGASRRTDKSWVRDRSASRERSLSPRSDRRSVASSQPPKPSKVTLVKSRKNEGKELFSAALIWSLCKQAVLVYLGFCLYLRFWAVNFFVG